MKRIILVSIYITNFLFLLFFSLTQNYPFFAVLLNIISVIILIYLLIDKHRVYNAITTYRNDLLIVAGLFFLAFFVYLYKVDIITPGLQGDELTIAKVSDQLLSSSNFVPFVPTNFGHPTPLLYFTGTSIHLFGRTIVAIRLPYIIFGALSIAAFYILLRLFFNKTIAIAASLLMLFSYPFIILSRLAYEVTPEIFFQIVSITFFFLAWKTKDIRYYAFMALSLGAGFYTYVGFRTFAFFLLVIVGYLFYKQSKSNKIHTKNFFIPLGAFFIVIVPLLSFSISQPQEIMARTTALSAFTQGYSLTETGKEILANTERLSHLFFMGNPTDANGDTNYTRNPANVSLFDIGTFVLFVIGLCFLFRSNKKLFLLVFVLSLSPILNDILVIEKIPQALNPYGIGHPNTLRIAGIIPIIYFVIAYGANEIRLLLKHNNRYFFNTFFLLVVFVISFYNGNLYFNQPLNTWVSAYVYHYNDVIGQHVADAINNIPAQTLYISPSFISDNSVKYFSRKNVTMIPYKPNSVNQIISNTNKGNLIILDPNYNTPLGVAYLKKIQSQPDLFRGKILTSPDNKVDAFILN